MIYLNMTQILLTNKSFFYFNIYFLPEIGFPCESFAECLNPHATCHNESGCQCASPYLLSNGQCVISKLLSSTHTPYTLHLYIYISTNIQSIVNKTSYIMIHTFFRPYGCKVSPVGQKDECMSWRYI